MYLQSEGSSKQLPSFGVPGFLLLKLCYLYLPKLRKEDQRRGEYVLSFPFSILQFFLVCLLISLYLYNYINYVSKYISYVSNYLNYESNYLNYVSNYLNYLRDQLPKLHDVKKANRNTKAPWFFSYYFYILMKLVYVFLNFFITRLSVFKAAQRLLFKWGR